MRRIIPLKTVILSPAMATPFVTLLRRLVAGTLPFTSLIFLATFPALAGDETGQPAPRFRARTTSGEQFNNESIKGKVVLFEFWTTWCKYCEEEAELVD